MAKGQKTKKRTAKAPKPSKIKWTGLTKSQSIKASKEYKALVKSGHSEGYAKRIAKGVAKGKTRQEARGHHKGEARERREREVEKHGLEIRQLRQIEKFYTKEYNPKGYRAGGEEDMATLEEWVEVAQESGWDKYKQAVKVWRAARKEWLGPPWNGKKTGRGMDYLHSLMGLMDVSIARLAYYH